MRKFPWGRVIEDIEVGPYMVRAYHPHKSEGVTITREIDTDTINYHGYVDGRDTNISWGSLDEALAGLIVYRNLGPNNDNIAGHFVAGVNAMAKKD
jgi:hypothetical protein